MFLLCLQNMWIERTIYVTAYKLPGILRWFEVKSVFMVRSIWLYWDCMKAWGSCTARQRLYFWVTVLQFCEQAINGTVSGVLGRGDLLAKGASYWLRVTQVMLFHSWEKETQADSPRPLGQVPIKYFKYFSKSISGFQQVNHYSLWHKPWTWNKEGPEVVQGNPATSKWKQSEVWKRGFGILIVIYSKYTKSGMHCICLHLFFTYHLCLKVVFCFFSIIS